MEIRPHCLENKPRRGLQPPRRHPRRPAPPRCGRRPETHPLLHLWPIHIRPLRARASLGQAVSINLNHRSRQQVKPHRRHHHLRVPPLVPSLAPVSSNGSGRLSRPVLGLASRWTPVRVQAASATRIAARAARRRYVGLHSVSQCEPAHLHESRPCETRQRNRWRWKQRRSTSYGFVRSARHVHQGVLLKYLILWTRTMLNVCRRVSPLHVCLRRCIIRLNYCIPGLPVKTLA